MTVKMIHCPICNKYRPSTTRGMCNTCYRRIKWPRKLKTCKSCGRIRPHQAFGLCPGCHMRVYHYDKIKEHNAQKRYNISLETLQKITTACVICNFSKIVELHHLDGKNAKSNTKNLVGLCPNCHKQIHSYEFFEDIKKKLLEKGYDVSGIHPTSYAKDRPQKDRYIPASKVI